MSEDSEAKWPKGLLRVTAELDVEGRTFRTSQTCPLHLVHHERSYIATVDRLENHVTAAVFFNAVTYLGRVLTPEEQTSIVTLVEEVTTQQQ